MDEDQSTNSTPWDSRDALPAWHGERRRTKIHYSHGMKHPAVKLSTASSSWEDE
jgi:hypothetical protein